MDRRNLLRFVRAVAATVGVCAAAAADNPSRRPAPAPRAAAPGGAAAANTLASARAWQAQYAKDGQPAHLEAAWTALQAVLSAPDGGKDVDDAVRLAPAIILRLRNDVVQPWLVAYVADHPDRGLAVVEALGELLTKPEGGPADADRRAKLLKLVSGMLNTAVGPVPASAGQVPQKLLVSYATVWTREAEALRQEAAQPSARPNRLPQDRADLQPAAATLSVYDLMDAAPSERLIAALADGTVRGRLLQCMVRTYLAEGEEAAAFDRIEQTAPSDAAGAAALIAEFLQAWAKNHKTAAPAGPQSYATSTGQVVTQIATGPPAGRPGTRRGVVPVTHSVQETNLADLARWVARIRALAVRPPDEALLVQAFLSCHAPNAIFTADAVQTVLGPIRKLQPDSVRTVAEQLRANVNALRGQVAQQKSAGKLDDLRAAIAAGYAATRAVLAGALAGRPDDWQLALAQAVVTFDELDFEHDGQAKADFTARRAEIMAAFARAATLYARQVDDRADARPDVTVFEQWFAAALGASDLGALTEAKSPDPLQPAKIRAAMRAIPGEAGERHVAAFAAGLFPHMAAVKPAMKPRFLLMGAEVVNDHPRLGPAKKLLAYYKDLSKEVRLAADLDGSPAVGAMQPFGVFLHLHHTKEVEQSSGGFGRFLQNQIGNNAVARSGIPPANYRDRFEAAVRAALAEHFEVVSCTFETDKVASRPTADGAGRVTPYAYLLLKARGPQVDRLPPLQLDLDFLDGAGYVVIPIESPAVPLNAARRDPRPAEQVSVTQTLDERKSADGVLRLDVKATARGLVPEFDQLLAPVSGHFEIVKVEARPLSVVKFDSDGPTAAIASERTWQLTLRARPDAADSHFQFPAAARPSIDVKLLRYRDADLVPAEAEIEVGGGPAAPVERYREYVPVAGGALLALAGGVALVRRFRATATAGPPTVLKRPHRLTPVTVVGYLRRVAEVGRIPDDQRAEVWRTIRALEAHYFSGQPDDGAPPALEAIVAQWSAVRV